MATIPLVANTVHTPEQPDIIGNYARILQLKNMLETAPLQRQRLQQEIAAGQTQQQTAQLQLQQEQQAQKDQQMFRTAIADPKLQGKSIGEVADVLASQGNISPQAWQGAKKADLEHREQLQKIDQGQLANLKAGHDATQQLYDNVMKLPDDQLAANWPSVAQQYNAIPGNQKTPLNPQQPLTKQQLSQFGPILSMNNSYLDEELSRREKTAKTALAEQEAAAGGTTDLAKFQSDWLKANNLENTPANRQKAFDAYTQKTKIAPAAVRAQVFMQMPQAVFDPKTGKTVFVTRQQAIGQETPTSIDAGTLRDMVTGKDSQTLNAINTAYYHIKNFEDAAKAVNGGDIKALNQIANAYGVQVQNGQSPQVILGLVKTAVKGEMARAFTGAGATVDEQHELEKSFDSANSLQTMLGVAQTARTLIHGKEVVLSNKYEQGMQGKPNFMGLSGDDRSPNRQANDPFAQFGGKAH